MLRLGAQGLGVGLCCPGCLCPPEATPPPLLTPLTPRAQVTARKFEEARRVFHTALEATQWTHVPTLLGLARLESGALKMDLARDLFKRALDLQPDSVPLLQVRGAAEGRRVD